MMETLTDILLVTANVGSLFDNLGEIQYDWLREFYTTMDTYKPRFVALHFQEVGGKDYKANMAHAENFFWTIESSPEMSDFDRACVYIDSDFKTEDNFTALGSIYFIHKSLENIQQYDFSAKEFRSVSGRNKYAGSLYGVTTVWKEKFQRNFWPDRKWSRKGYMRTRWMIHNQGLDLVNVHLFHDASNLVACKSSPSVYSTYRQKALRYVISRISDDFSTMPFFLFGDFNFRLDTLSLVQDLSTSAEVQMVMKDSTNEVEKIIYEEKGNDCKQVLFQIETKRFLYLHHKLFREDTGRELLEYDRETAAFQDIITEEEILFRPSYPYSEEYTKPTQYMNTRCPSWCDRILMSHSTQDVIYRSNDGDSNVVYNILGQNVCMGDHKPVFLFFALKSNVQTH
ncbi:inositol polyphosphate-5-phosphatase A isoform X1 [Tachysurus fulvidraco]|uniref:inositol polyphosphate-5-phosphatase A isoform X1 n=1 Tax=Tachysurus fulvidraco TaxID=1234273 RepID=UPI001FEED338|nr:inositol polyphosphate-5-phosphatase A isoform X1 [Tachysurus fulvidraco]